MQEIQGPTDLPNAHWEGGGGVAGGGGPGGGYGVAGYGLVLCEARWYGDGQFYQALRGPRTSGGGHLVTFTGHEEDKPQVTQPPCGGILAKIRERRAWALYDYVLELRGGLSIEPCCSMGNLLAVWGTFTIFLGNSSPDLAK